jgi:hypothetical protein
MCCADGMARAPNLSVTLTMRCLRYLGDKFPDGIIGALAAAAIAALVAPIERY